MRCALEADHVHDGNDIVSEAIAVVDAGIVRFAAKTMATTVHANHLAALRKQEVDPPGLLPVALKAGQPAVDQQNWCACPDHFVVDRHAC
jgi:hypothetical protein